MARRSLVAGGLALSLLAGTLLTGCAHQDAGALASQACARVARGLAIEQRATLASGPTAVRLRGEALAEVRSALPLAAVAAGEDTTWQALGATLSETNRVPLTDLVHALRAQCAGTAG